MLRRLILNFVTIIFAYWFFRYIWNNVNSDNKRYEKLYREFFKKGSLVIRDEVKIKTYIELYVKIADLYRKSIELMSNPEKDGLSDCIVVYRETRKKCLDSSRYLSKEVAQRSMSLIDKIYTQLKIYCNQQDPLYLGQSQYNQKLLEKMSVQLRELKDSMRSELVLTRKSSSYGFITSS